MAIVDLRQRSGFLFLAVMLGHVLLISAQVNSRAGVPVLEMVTFGVFAQVQRGISSVLSSVGRVGGGYVALRHVKSDNEELRRELAAAQVAVQEERAQADRARGLERLLGLRDSSNLPTVAAQVIAAGASPDFKTLTVDKGTRDGLMRDMAVIAPAGVVGRVVLPTARAAKVQLLIDRNAAAGALIERSRAQGVVIGRGDTRLSMEYVSEIADIVVGDLVVSSGIDGIYPKGYAIGQVESVDKAAGGSRQIVVKPTVDFSSLEEVLVVVTRAPATGEKDAGEGTGE